MTRKQDHICSDITHNLKCKYCVLHKISDKIKDQSKYSKEKIKPKVASYICS